MLRGHEDSVYSAQFSPDGKAVVTASGSGSILHSEDETARLWSCEVCSPIEEIATELAKKVGRELTPEERRRFGVPDSPLFEK